MSADALAKAREIAARLSGNLTGTKRNRWGDESGDNPGLGAVQKKKLYIPVNEYPHINFLGLLIGPKGATQKQLQDSSGAKILIRGKGASKDGTSSAVHPDDDDELHVAIEGSEDAVERASREVEKILYNPEQAMKLKSEQLRTLAEMNNQGSDSIYGPGNGGSGDSYQIELRVPNNMVGLIIGRGGENILRIQSQLSVNVQIAKESEMKPGETLRSIVIKGQQDNVEEAKKRIDEIITQQNQKQSGGGLMGGANAMKELDTKYVLKVPVPNDKVGIIIGRGGMNIKAIQEKTKTTVQIPQAPDEDNPNTRTILIGGDIQDSIYQARDEILLTVQMQQQSVQQQMGATMNPMYVTVPDDKVGIIIGKGGATVKDIQNRLNVKIQIPQSADVGSNPPMRTISIVGPAEFQPVAKYEIEMIVAGTPVQSVGAAGSVSAWASAGTATTAAWPQQAYAQYYSDPAYAAAYAQYGYYGASTAGATSTTATASTEQDLTAYYNEFWQYAQYYGEAAARAYYQAWSPPEGTSPPEGIVVPSAEVAAANIAAATGAIAADGTATATASTPATATTATGTEQDQQQATSASTNDATATDDDEAWEAYKKQYAEWYEAYGKALGADPNPPAR